MATFSSALVASVTLSSATMAQPGIVDQGSTEVPAGYNLANDSQFRQTERGLEFGQLPTGFILRFDLEGFAHPLRRQLSAAEAKQLSGRVWEVGLVLHSDKGPQIGEVVLFEVNSGNPISLGVYDFTTGSPFSNAVTSGLPQSAPQSAPVGSIALCLLAAIALGSWWLQQRSRREDQV